MSRPSWEMYASDPIATIRAVAAGIDFATAWTQNPTIDTVLAEILPELRARGVAIEVAA